MSFSRTVSFQHSFVCFCEIRGPDDSPLNLTVTVELSVRETLEYLYPSDPVVNKRLKLVIRWLHPTTGDKIFFQISTATILPGKSRLFLSICFTRVCAGEPPEGYNVEVRPSIPPTHSSIEDTSLCTEHFTDFFHHVEYSVSSFYYILNSGVVRVDPLVFTMYVYTLLFLFCRLLEIIIKKGTSIHGNRKRHEKG
jgi:hypothetical protein